MLEPIMERCPVCAEPTKTRPCARCGERIDSPTRLAPEKARTPIGEYLNGLRIGLRGFVMTLRTPRLLGLVAIPVLINLALLVALGRVFLDYAEAWSPEFTETWVRGTDWLRSPLRTTIGGLLGLLALVAALIGMLLTSSVVNAPFHEWISEGVETIVFGKPDPRPMDAVRIWRVWIWPVVQAAFLALLQGVLAIAFLLASFSGVLAPLSPVGSVYLIALTLVDVVIARKACPIAERFRTVHRALPTWLGLATPLFIVPFLLPFFVAGATLVYLRDLRTRVAPA